MFSLGFGEILVICVILILVVGPERLPTVMKGVGKTMRTVREASREIRTTVGLDELMRDDPPRPIYRPPPPATIARAEPLPADTQPPADTTTTTTANAAPAVPPEPAAGTAVAAATQAQPQPPPGGENAVPVPTPPTDPDKAGA